MIKHVSQKHNVDLRSLVHINIYTVNQLLVTLGNMVQLPLVMHRDRPIATGIYSAMTIHCQQLDMYVNGIIESESIHYGELLAMIPSWYADVFFDEYEQEKRLDYQGKIKINLFKNIMVSTPFKQQTS